MFLKKIKLNNFRNYEHTEIEFSPTINIIYGDNAQGKTNLLEAIYFLAVTKSHHSFLDSKLIKDGYNSLKVEGILKSESLDQKYTITLNDNKKSLKVDEKTIKKISDYISNINIIIFYPDDLNLIKGSPNDRRRYINIELSQLSSKYFEVLGEFNKLLKIRNEYLKKYVDRIDFDEKYFEILTEHLIDKSIYIYKMRNKYIEKINNYCKNISLKIFGTENFCINYVHNFNQYDFNDSNIKNLMINEFKKNNYRERKYKNTVLGPHKDDFEFIYENKNLKLYGSQGQQRLGVLILKLAEIEIFNDYKNTKPILLLDDVFSELDNVKKNNLLFYIDDDIQTIITTTELSNLDEKLIKKANLIKIVNGKKEEVE